MTPPNPHRFLYVATGTNDLVVSDYYTFNDEPECGAVTCELRNTNVAAGTCDTVAAFAEPSTTMITISSVPLNYNNLYLYTTWQLNNKFLQTEYTLSFKQNEEYGWKYYTSDGYIGTGSSFATPYTFCLHCYSVKQTD